MNVLINLPTIELLKSRIWPQGLPSECSRSALGHGWPVTDVVPQLLFSGFQSEPIPMSSQTPFWPNVHTPKMEVGDITVGLRLNFTHKYSVLGGREK